MRSNLEDARLQKVLVGHRLVERLEEVAGSRIGYLFDRFTNNFSLAVVEQADSKGVKGLLQPNELVYVHSILVERYAAAFADLRFVRMLVGRTHLEMHADQISYFIGLATVNDLSSVDNRAVRALVGKTFLPSQRKGVIETINAESDPNAGRKCYFFIFLLILSECILDIEGSLEYGPLEVGSRMSKSATYSVEVANGDICGSFEYFLQRKGQFFFGDVLTHLFR